MVITSKLMQRRLGFLAAAPRISTHSDAEMSGPRSRVLGLISGFNKLGWEVDRFIVGDRVPKTWSAKGSGQAISRGFFRTLAVDVTRLGLGLLNSFRSYQELKNQVDCVYEYAATLQCLGWIFQRRGIPWILQVEALLFYEAKAERKALVLDKLAKWMEVRAYQKCDVLACVSDTLKDILVTDFKVSPEKIVLVPNGVDIDFINPQLHTPKRIFSGFTVGFVGSLYAWAGLDILLEAISELKSEGIDISLVVVGDGVMKPIWEDQVKKLGISKSVTFLGRLSWQEVPQYIAGCDIGFSGQIQLQIGKMYLSPMKLYEYMAMAKPVIASAFEDAQRLICEGKTGFIFEPGNKKDLKQALIQAFTRQEQLPKMGQLARQEIEKNHSWTARVNALIEGSNKVLKKQLKTEECYKSSSELGFKK
jgi:glycosyltransferase involved in cell wall biosynthesis